MKKLLGILIFIAIIYGCYNQQKQQYHFTIVGSDKKTMNFNHYINENKIDLVYFYDQFACPKCFFSQMDNLQNLSKKNNFIIVTNLNSIRELKAFKNAYKLNKVFLSDYKFNKGSFYLEIKTDKIIIPDTNNDNLNLVDDFTKKYK